MCLRDLEAALYGERAGPGMATPGDLAWAGWLLGTNLTVFPSLSEKPKMPIHRTFFTSSVSALGSGLPGCGCSRRNVRGPADWPVLGSLMPACVCATSSAAKDRGLREGKRKNRKVECKLYVIALSFVLHKYLSSSLDLPGI